MVWRIIILLLVAMSAQAEGLRLNELQYIGTHNSYHIEPDAAVMALLRDTRYEDGEKWSWDRLIRAVTYTHPPLSVQLGWGVRNFELDIYADTKGGRYTNPGALAAADEQLSSAYDLQGKLEQPGFKVFHVADIDVRSSCLLFVDCLQQIKQWSSANPQHIPVIVLLEAKSKTQPPVGDYVATVPESFTSDVWQDLEREILSVFDQEQIITPDTVRGDNDSLRDAVKTTGWPLVTDVLGKIMFVVLHQGPATDAYMADNALLKGRLMFVNLPLDHPSASFVLTTKPHKEKEFRKIQRYSKRGFLVYTRGDANTEESRSNALSRSSYAFLSGAQIISTDYPNPDYRFSDYKVQFNHGDFVRCNPHVAGDKCP